MYMHTVYMYILAYPSRSETIRQIDAFILDV